MMGEVVVEVIKTATKRMKYIEYLCDKRDELIDNYIRSLQNDDIDGARKFIRAIQAMNRVIEPEIMGVIAAGRMLARYMNDENHIQIFRMVFGDNAAVDEKTLLALAKNIADDDIKGCMREIIGKIENEKEIEPDDKMILIKAVTAYELYHRIEEVMERLEVGVERLKTAFLNFLEARGIDKKNMDLEPKAMEVGTVEEENIDWRVDLKKYIEKRLNPDVDKAYN